MQQRSVSGYSSVLIRRHTIEIESLWALGFHYIYSANVRGIKDNFNCSIYYENNNDFYDQNTQQQRFL